jgi:hypothetical protein
VGSRTSCKNQKIVADEQGQDKSLLNKSPAAGAVKMSHAHMAGNQTREWISQWKQTEKLRAGNGQILSLGKMMRHAKLKN